MRAVLAALGRLLGVQLAARVGDGLPRSQARALLVVVVLVANLAPVLAVLTGAIGYGDVWLWLALEVLTIYAWTVVRLVRTSGDRPGGGFVAVFFGVHFGVFALVPLLVGTGLVLPWSPLRSPALTVLALGGIGFAAYGWSVAPQIRDRVPVGAMAFSSAYARMFLAYAAMFVPMVATGLSAAGRGTPATAAEQGHEAVIAVCVLLVKLALELFLTVGVEHREGQVRVLGRPVTVVRTTSR